MDIRVLVVDDSSVQRDHAIGICRAIGVDNVTSACDGEVALHSLRKMPVDVVLVDLEMPVIDGVELINFIAAEKLAKAIVVISAKDSSLISSVATMAEAAGLRVLGSIQKPVSQETMTQALGYFYDHAEDSEDLAICDMVDGCSNIAAAICHQEFFLHFQPKLTTQGLLLKGVESLARWQHPDLGNIPPVQFIADAESRGLIGILTFHLLERALKQQVEWKKRGLNFNVAFNLSPLSLSNEDFADWIYNLVISYGIKPADFTLEITENVLLGDVAKSIQTLARLRLRGFLIAIDDYGSGFANAEQLSKVPATELKIDRSMIDGVSKKTQLQKILKSTVLLAKDLGLTTVAEGIETLADFQVVADLGVDMVQGYYFSKPLTSSDIPLWINRELRSLREQV